MLNRLFYPSFVAASLIFVLFPGCNNQKTATSFITRDSIPKVTAKGSGIPGSFSTQTKIKFDSDLVKNFLDSFPKFKQFENDISNFYKARDYAYAWYDDNGMIEPANNLYNRIQHLADEGIQDSLPYKTAFSNLMENEEGNDKTAPVLELMLTSQYLTYAKTAWEGISEKQTVATEWLLPRKKITAQQLLDSLANGNNVLENSPVYRQYNLLKAYLKKYTALKKQNNFTDIQADKKSYRMGDSSSTISAIRERLFSFGDLTTDNRSQIFDSTLHTGVKNFEHRFGYKEDGIINTALLAEMNYPLEKSIEQIIVNMERSRWIPVKPGTNYLVVNIPEFKLHVYENDSLAWSMNVVVGKNQHKTVVFNGDLKYIVFSPYWYIPASILKKETLPAIKRNPNYLATHNMEWNGGAVRQKPGPNNSLGLVKFLFPNSHSIYLHDSPAKSLFNEDSRAFSHGCIRLAEPKKLAVYLLRDDAGWTEKSIGEAMAKGTEKYVTLKNTIPVFITYFTTWVDRRGNLNFRHDIYDRNTRLAKMIFEKPVI